jgi:hypothetical protein
MPDWIAFRKGVPDGSRMLIEATSVGAASAVAEIVSTGDDDGRLAAGEIDPGPGLWTLSAPEVYLVKVRIGFTGPGSATIRMSIARPDGTAHSVPEVWDASGVAGDVLLCSMIVQTA